MSERYQVPLSFRIFAGDELTPVTIDAHWQRISKSLLPVIQQKGVRCFFVFEDGREVEVTESVRRAVARRLPDTPEIPIQLLVPEVWDIIERRSRYAIG